MIEGKDYILEGSGDTGYVIAHIRKELVNFLYGYQLKNMLAEVGNVLLSRFEDNEDGILYPISAGLGYDLELLEHKDGYYLFIFIRIMEK